MLELHCAPENVASTLAAASADALLKPAAKQIKRDPNDADAVGDFDWDWLDECNNRNGKRCPPAEYSS